VNDTPSRRYLTRKEAAAYLTQNWLKISVGTLARYATDSIGPPYKSANGNAGQALYDREELDNWAKSFPTVRRGERKPITPSPARAKRAKGALSQIASAR
jgi:hypothetical protein